ncbi:hypothetical protein SAMN05192544_112221, partial [Paraburkholderia hospita]
MLSKVQASYTHSRIRDERKIMIKLAILATMEAKPGKE